jgi:hypothetical protein
VREEAQPMISPSEIDRPKKTVRRTDITARSAVEERCLPLWIRVHEKDVRIASGMCGRIGERVVPIRIAGVDIPEEPIEGRFLKPVDSGSPTPHVRYRCRGDLKDLTLRANVAGLGCWS